jgi:Holliday junction resolvase
MNSREKGKRGERQWRDELRANGYAARRGQQFAGSPESPDVVCDSLPWIHFEVKAVERLRIHKAMDQARRQAGPAPNAAGAAKSKVPIVAHKRNFGRWLVTMEAETFFKFLRGDLPPQACESPPKAPLPPVGRGASRDNARRSGQDAPQRIPTEQILTEDACLGQRQQREKGNGKEKV